MVVAAQLVAKVSADGAEQTERALQSVGAQADVTQGRFHGMGGGVRSMVGGLLEFGAKLGTTIFGLKSLGDAAISTGQFLFGGNAALEQVRISMEAFTGSTASANKLLKELQIFAATTPFEFPDIQSASLKLLNMGVNAKDVQGYLHDIGSAVSKVGGSGAELVAVTDIIQQMGNEGKVSYENLKQLSDHNIPAMKLLAQAMHVPIATLQQMASSGQLGADKVKLLVDVLGNFGGKAMEKQSTTFIGLLGTLKDNVQLALNSFTGPLFDMAKQGLTQLGNLVSNPAFQQFATGAGQQVANVFRFIGQGVQQAMQFLSPLEPVLRQIGSTISNVFSVLSKGGGGGFLASLTQGFQQVSSIVGGQFQQNFKMVQGILQDLGRWWQSTMQPALAQAMPAFQRLGQVMATTVAPAIAKVWAVGQGLMREVLPPLTKAFEHIAPIVLKVGSFLADNLGKAIQFLSPYIVQATQVIGKFAGEILSRVIPIVQQIWSQIKAGLDWLLPLWNAVWPAIQQVLKGVWDAIRGTVQMVWSIVSGIIKTGLDLIQGKWGAVWEDIKGIFTGVWNGIKTVAQGTWDALWGIIKGGINFVIGLINKFIEGLDSIHIDVGPVHVGINIPTIPYLASGVENFAGGLAYVHRDELLVNMAPGTTVIPASRSGAQSIGGGSDRPIILELDGRMVARLLLPYQANEMRYKLGTRF